jgi:hypothetical protein
MKHDGDRTPREIQADIERTRSRLNETLSAIEHRLTPEQLVDQGIDYLRHSGAREYVANLGASAKRDPLPLAFVVVGLGWLMMSGSRNSGRHGPFTGPGPSADERVEGARDAASSVREAASSVRDTVSSAVSSVGEKVSSVRDSAARTSQKIARTTRAARERVHEASDAAREGIDRLQSGFGRLAHEQPLALGAIGIAVGAMLAAVTPRTRQEDSLMGDASDRLKDQAKEAGEQHLDTPAAALGASGRGTADTADAVEPAEYPTSTTAVPVSTATRP